MANTSENALNIVNGNLVRNLGEEAASELGMRRVNPQLEYLAGGEPNPSWNFLYQLPTPDDDLDNLVGNDVYTRMGNDEQVTASTMLLIMMTLRRPMTLDPAFADADETSEDFKRSIKVRDFYLRSFDNLRRHRGSLYRLQFELLYNAMRFGNGCAEITREWGEGEDSKRYYFKYIKVKHRTSYAFVIDAFWNLVGFASYNGLYGAWLGEMKRLVLAGLKNGGNVVGAEELEETPGMWKYIPREKFAVLSLLTENNDPRGKSWWRSVYNAWQQKMRRIKQLDLFAKRFGLPVVFGTTSEDATEQHPLGANGLPDLTKPKVTPEQALLQALMQMQGGDALAAKHGTKIEAILNSNDGGAFNSSLGYHDSQIVKGITFQKLATSPDAHQAKSSGEIHQDVLNSPVHYLKNMYCEMFYNDILAPDVEINFGPTWRKYTPKPNLGRIDPEDLARLLTALGQALQAGGVHYSMLPEIWAEWGLPPADIEAWIEDIRASKGATTDGSGRTEVVPGKTKPKPKPADPAQRAEFSFAWWPFKKRLSEPSSEKQPEPTNEPLPTTMETVLALVAPEQRAFARGVLTQWQADWGKHEN